MRVEWIHLPHNWDGGCCLWTRFHERRVFLEKSDFWTSREDFCSVELVG